MTAYSTPPWDEGEGSRDAWKDRARGARKRATSGYLQADMTQSDLPVGDSLIRLLTIRYGEQVQHWLDDPVVMRNEGKKKAIVENCAAPIDYLGDKSDLCPMCVYGMERGNRDSGGCDTQYYFYVLAIIGKIETVMYRDSANPSAPAIAKQEIVWDFEPKIFACTGPLFNSMIRRLDDVDYPIGAGGDITKYAFKITKTQTTSAKGSARYSADPYGQVCPTPAEVDTNLLPMLWEKIRKICEPAKAEYLAEKLGMHINPSRPIEQAPSDFIQPDGTAIADGAAQKIGGTELELEPPIVPTTQQAQPTQAPSVPLPAQELVPLPPVQQTPVINPPPLVQPPPPPVQPRPPAPPAQPTQADIEGMF